MTLRRRYVPVSDLDSILGPALRNASHLPPRRAVLAVTTRGRDAGVSRFRIHRWLTLPGDPAKQRLAPFTSTYPRFRPLADAADAYLAANSDLAERRKRIGACISVLVGQALSPVPEERLPTRKRRKAVTETLPDGRTETRVVEIEKPIGAHRVAMGRHAAVVVGGLVLDSWQREPGWDTATVSAEWLAVLMGCTRRSAGEYLRVAVELGWLIERRKPSRRRAGRYALPARLPSGMGHARELTARLSDVIDAIADRSTAELEAADLIMNAGHATWSHSHGSKTWLVALAVEAGVDPRQLGVAPGVARGSVKAWTGMLDRHDGLCVPTTDVLDAEARATGADGRRREAEARRRVEAEACTVEIREAQARRKLVRDGLATMLAANPIPKPKASTEKRRAWLDAMSAIVANSASLTDSMRADLCGSLALRMRATNIGYDEATARRVANLVAGLSAE